MLRLTKDRLIRIFRACVIAPPRIQARDANKPHNPLESGTLYAGC
jgi:hypothetical protein